MLSNSLPLIFKAGIPCTPRLYAKNIPNVLPQKSSSSSITHVIQQLPLVCQDSIPGSFSARHKGLSSSLAFGAKNEGSGEEDNRALEAVLKLYTALRNRNMTELSEVIGEECRCVCNFISTFQSFYGKQEVLDFFYALMELMGNQIQFVVTPTLHDGLNVGVLWKLEWKQTGLPLGRGSSFHMVHVYQGKALIRNFEMFMEPLFHIEPLRMKLMGYVMAVVDKIGATKGKFRMAICLLLAITLFTALLYII